MVQILGKLGDCNLVDWMRRILNQCRKSWHTFLDSQLRVGIFHYKNIKESLCCNICNSYWFHRNIFQSLECNAIAILKIITWCPFVAMIGAIVIFTKYFLSLHSFYHLQMFMVPYWRAIQASGWVEASQRQLRISNVRSEGCLMPY